MSHSFLIEKSFVFRFYHTWASITWIILMCLFICIYLSANNYSAVGVEDCFRYVSKLSLIIEEIGMGQSLSFKSIPKAWQCSSDSISSYGMEA